MDSLPATVASQVDPTGVLPSWHRDLSRLDPHWADAAARVVEMLARSDRQMVEANAKGQDSEQTALAYAALLAQLRQMEEETLRRTNESWLDNLHRKFLGRKQPLVERMEKLMQNRHTLITGTRQRIHGLREALDIRSQADEEAMKLLQAVPQLQEKAQEHAQRAAQALAGLSEDEDFARFRELQLAYRDAERLPGLLLGVRQQLQGAVMTGASLRDAIDGYLHIEEVNQTRFELAFGAAIGSLATLQGMQKSMSNATAAAGAMDLLPAPRKEGGSSFSGVPRLKKLSEVAENLQKRREPPPPPSVRRPRI